MRWFKNGLRFLLVTVGIVVLTSLGIDATDTLRGSQSALGLLAEKTLESSCPNGTVLVDRADASFCIDIYEVSLGQDCSVNQTNSALSTKEALSDNACQAESVAGALPWNFVTFHQAKELCARRGMRLPTSEEWYEAVLGTPTGDECNINGSRAESGQFNECRSARGVHDMVGNVWEWVDESVSGNVYRERTLPEEGYVTDADHTGVALETRESPDPLFDSDYFWASTNGEHVMMRGGFYNSQSDAGVYAVHTEVTPSFSSAAIGFRCAQSQ